MKSIRLSVCLTLVSLLALAVPAAADVVTTSGLTVTTPAANTTVTNDFLVNNNLPSQIIFNELQNVTLGSALVTDTGTIAAGTVVDSHFFALNGPTANVTTSVTFDGNVLGVVYLDGSQFWSTTDALGLSSLHYAQSGCGFCGFENGDTVSFSGHTITFSNNYDSPGDFARIITAAAPAVPEPQTLLLMCSGLIAVGNRLRKR